MNGRPEILWCPKGTAGRSGKNGWAFPRDIERLLQQATFRKSVLHLFGGRASWGLLMDIDPATRPNVVADAWMPPFAHRSFDVVILDPPYERISLAERLALFHAAAFVARESIWWFSTLWVSQPPGMRLVESWLVRAGENSLVRCLQHFRLMREFQCPAVFRRGPARKYLRWIESSAARKPKIKSQAALETEMARGGGRLQL